MIVKSIVNNRGVNVVQNVLPSWERENNTMAKKSDMTFQQRIKY